ncbi:unnamed protein product [Victoria cruziana]
MLKPEIASPAIPWRLKLLFYVMCAVADFSVRKDGTINRLLLQCLEFRAPANSRPVKGVSTADFTVDQRKGLWLRIFSPAGVSAEEKLPVIVFFHGGGFVYLRANSRHYDAVCRRFARRLRAFVVSVDYRLAPEHRFPTAYDDAEAAVRWISMPGRLPESADLRRCFLAGDSAGANIVHHVGSRIAAALKPEAKNSHDFCRIRIVGHVLIQPYFSGEDRLPSELRLRHAPIASLKRTDNLWRLFLPEGSDRDHPAANVVGPRAPDLAALGLPPSLVVVGGFDQLQDRQRLYYERLRKAGVEARLVEYPKVVHAFYVFPQFPESRELLSEIKSFMEEHS